jgi:chitin disaccharide deacetylase
MPTVILCADDFAIAPGVSQGICALLKKKRLSATSCMSISPLWREHAPLLKPFGQQADIGLHLTLTDFSSLSPLSFTDSKQRLPPFGTVLKLAYRNRLNAEEIFVEFQRQLEAFETAFGRMPDFIDGHQHIHQLPVIRKAVFALFKTCFSNSDTYLRVCWENPILIMNRRVDIMRTLSIGWPGSAMRRLANQEGVAFNVGFSGIYDFSPKKLYQDVFSKFLLGVHDRSLIMCHPGKVDTYLASVDSLVEPRELEYRFFDSDAFQYLLDKRGVQLGRFND